MPRRLRRLARTRAGNAGVLVSNSARPVDRPPFNNTPSSLRAIVNRAAVQSLFNQHMALFALDCRAVCDGSQGRGWGAVKHLQNSYAMTIVENDELPIPKNTRPVDRPHQIKSVRPSGDRAYKKHEACWPAAFQQHPLVTASGCKPRGSPSLMLASPSSLRAIVNRAAVQSL